MFKMDTHTKQIFLAGVLAYITTVSGLVFNYSVMQENHRVRINMLESTDIKSNVTLNVLVSEMARLSTKNATIEVMLETLNFSVVQLNKTTEELGKIAARLDERSKPRQ